jgi:hypothetical protein
MLIDWLQKPSTITWGIYFTAAELSSCLPSYSFSCILVSNENHAKDYSGNQPCATMHEAAPSPNVAPKNEGWASKIAPSKNASSPKDAG